MKDRSLLLTKNETRILIIKFKSVLWQNKVSSGNAYKVHTTAQQMIFYCSRFVKISKTKNIKIQRNAELTSLMKVRLNYWRNQFRPVSSYKTHSICGEAAK